jgi:hypothetical protein
MNKANINIGNPQRHGIEWGRWKKTRQTQKWVRLKESDCNFGLWPGRNSRTVWQSKAGKRINFSSTNPNRKLIGTYCTRAKCFSWRPAREKKLALSWSREMGFRAGHQSQ